MAPSTLLLLLLVLLSSATLSLPDNPPQDDPFLPSRRTLKEDPQTLSPPNKKLNTTTTKKNTTNPLKPKSTNSTTTTKTITDSTKKNTTKLLTPKSSNSYSTKTPTSSKNTTKLLTSKSTNSSSTTTNIKTLTTSKNTTKLLQSNFTTIKKNTTTKPFKTNSTKPSNSTANKKTVPITPSLDDDDDGSRPGLASELRYLPSRFHEAVVPDLHRISTTSRAYLSLASMEFTRSFRPLVGTTYATPLARLAFASLLFLPFLLAAYGFRHLRHHHLPLQKVALSASIYLAVYFSVLALAGAAAGTEPLRAFHAASPGAYVGTQVIMMMGYATYLLLLVVEAAAVGGRGAAAAGLRLALATGVGVHYYTAVFHRAVAGQPPRTSWRVHAVYAACLAAVCALARAERGGKKEYLHGGGGQDCKTS